MNLDTHTAVKTQLDLNNVQRTLLSRHAGVSRYVYNWGLQRRNEQYAATGKGLTYPQQNLELTKLKADNPWMYEVSKWVGQDALRCLDAAFSRFFKKQCRFPKFRSKNRGKDHFQFPCWNGQQQSVIVEANRIKLPVIGWLRTHEDLRRPGRAMTATVSRDGTRWMVSVSYEHQIEIPQNNGPEVGVDLGITTLATLSDGVTCENPRHLQNSLRLLKRRQQSVSRKVKGSQRRRKAVTLLQNVHRRIRHRRADIIHKLTTSLAKRYSRVAIEDLNVSGMSKNHRLARALSDVCFGEVRRQLAYKCPRYGSELIVIDRFFPSSKTCSVCGNVQDMPLSERTYCCEKCGMTMDRDLNAAKNVLAAGYAVTARGGIGQPPLTFSDGATQPSETRTNQQMDTFA